MDKVEVERRLKEYEAEQERKRQQQWERSKIEQKKLL